MPSAFPRLLQWFFLHLLVGSVIGALEAGRFQFMATLVFSGLLVGIAQYTVLRSILRHSLRHPAGWIWASAIGWLVGTQLMISLGGWLDPIVAELTQWAGREVFWLNLLKQPIVFLGFGVAQSLLLRLPTWESRLESNHSLALDLPRTRRLALNGLRLRWIGMSIFAGSAQGGSSALFCAFFCPVLTEPLGTVLVTAIVYGVGWFSYSVITAPLLRRLLFEGAAEYV